MSQSPLLVDTCAAIWFMDNDPRMKPAAVEAIDAAGDRGESIFVSPITALEVATLARKGRFKSILPPSQWFDRLLRAPGMQLAEMTPYILFESQALPGNLHNDPADRIIAATAREFGYTVMTRDRALLDYASQGYLRAVEC